MTSPPADEGPPRRNAARSAEVCTSPGSSARATPSSEMFFGSGNTTPSYLTSPPPHQSGFTSPLTFSPPVSPPPLQTHLHRRLANPEIVEPHLVLSPAPAGHRISSTVIAENDDEDGSGATTPQPMPRRTRTESSRLSAYEPATSASSRVPAFYSHVKSKTENLERAINEIESSAPRAAESASTLLDPKKEHKRYTRRRYTDSRHPTKELPDVRLEIAKEVSVQKPPLRRTKAAVQ